MPKIYPAPIPLVPIVVPENPAPSKVSTPEPIPQVTRQNYYNTVSKTSEDYNSHPVIAKASVPTDSIGWTEKGFFQELGDKRYARWKEAWEVSVAYNGPFRETSSEQLLQLAQSQNNGASAAFYALLRRAEQEYLLANMVKGAMWAACDIAGKTGVAIAVRGTSVTAHMGIERGLATKAQEFKNKTSKLEDHILCDYISFEDVGLVVHYDPREDWTPKTADTYCTTHNIATPFDWDQNWPRYKRKLEALQERLTRVRDYSMPVQPLPSPVVLSPRRDAHLKLPPPLPHTVPSPVMNPLALPSPVLHPQTPPSFALPPLHSNQYLVQPASPSVTPPPTPPPSPMLLPQAPKPLPPQLGMYQLPDEASLKKMFFARTKEYFEEDAAYRKGKFKTYNRLDGPFVQVVYQGNDGPYACDMVGDHDLFAYRENDSDKIIADANDARITQAQQALQKSDGFQAQHGAIWYWAPATQFNKDIRVKIMGAHGPDGKEPLVLIQKDQIRAAYYCEPNAIKPVWDFKPNEAKDWMSTTHTGSLLKNVLVALSTRFPM